MKHTLLGLTILLATLSPAHGNNLNSNGTPIDHCYHWLKEETGNAKFLTQKYEYAAKNHGQIYNTAGGGGMAAGPGLYCALTLVNSIDYGDRVIRIDLVDDVTQSDYYGKKTCGSRGNLYSDQNVCNQKKEDINFYSSGNGWYVIKDLSAIKSWSANSKQLVDDIKETMKTDRARYYVEKLKKTIASIEKEAATMGQKTFVNGAARKDVLEMLADESKWDNFDMLGFIQQVASSEKIPAAKKMGYISRLTARLLKDEKVDTDFAKVQSLLATNNEFKKIYMESFKSLNLSKGGGNQKLIFRSVEELMIPLNPQQARSLIQASVGSLTSQDAAKFFSLKNPSLKAEVSRMLLDKKTFVGLISPTTAPLLAAYIVSESKKFTDLASYARLLIKAALQAKDVQVINTVTYHFQQLNFDVSPMVLDILTSDKELAKNLDPNTVAVCLNSIAAAKDPQKYASLKADLSEGLIQAQPSAADALRNGLLSSQYGFDALTFYTKVFEKSLAESSRSGSQNSTFKFISKEMPEIIQYTAQRYLTAEPREKAYKQAAQALLLLSNSLLKKSETESYSYALLQTSSLIAGGFLYTNHPTESLLKVYQTGDRNMDSLIETVIARANDPSLTEFLVTGLANQEVSDRARSLLGKVLSSFINTDLSQLENSITFVRSHIEKKTYTTQIGSKYYRSDFCSQALVLETYSQILKTEFANESSGIDDAISAVKGAGLCSNMQKGYRL